MGNLTSKTPTKKVLLGGLDAAGKTTLLYRWKKSDSEVVTTIPTIGFNVEDLELSSGRSRVTSITAWDVGGRGKIRPLSRHYYEGTDCLVWVVDSNDTEEYRMEQCARELQFALNDDELDGVPLLLLCNKQDLPGALSPQEVLGRLKLTGFGQRRVVCVLGMVATTGVGCKEALRCLDGLLEGGRAESKEDDSGVPRIPDYSVTAQAGNRTLQKFSKIQNSTECPFAKSAKLWGGKTVIPGTSLEEQAKANAPAFCRFVYECQGLLNDPIGHGSTSTKSAKHLDGFCIEIDHPSAREGGPVEFGECIRVFLTALSALDPKKEFVMQSGGGGGGLTTPSSVGQRGWRFRFAGADFFATTFAPCYPITSSRYAFGVGGAFLLLQPEISFLRHNLPADTPETRWENPETVRDKTRIAYLKAGRPYHIPSTTHYPPAEHIVKPLQDDGKQVIMWWDTPQELQQSK